MCRNRIPFWFCDWILQTYDFNPYTSHCVQTGTILRLVSFAGSVENIRKRNSSACSNTVSAIRFWVLGTVFLGTQASAVMTCSTNLTVICDTKGFAKRPEEIKILQISVKYETGEDQVLATVVKGNKPWKSNNLPLLVNGSFERGKESEAWLEAIYHNAPYGELSCVVKVEGDPRDENYQKFTTTAIFNSKTQPEIKKKGLALHVTQDCGTGSKSAAYKPIISPLVMIVVVILSLVSVSGSFF